MSTVCKIIKRVQILWDGGMPIVYKHVPTVKRSVHRTIYVHLFLSVSLHQC